uniref:Putative secreted protein n=1 Tax=Amblyomma cajennense TaxID=34607 RepID=A0A023FBL6_AMBCJ
MWWSVLSILYFCNILNKNVAGNRCLGQKKEYGLQGRPSFFSLECTSRSVHFGCAAYKMQCVKFHVIANFSVKLMC